MAEDTQDQGPQPGPPSSSADAALARAPGAAEATEKAQKEAVAAEKAASKAEDKEQADRTKEADRYKGEGDLTTSLTDPATGKVLDSSELQLANARSDVAPAPAVPASEEERIRVANRTEDPTRALDLLRSGTPASELDEALKSKKK